MRILGIDPGLRLTGYGVIEHHPINPVLVDGASGPEVRWLLHTADAMGVYSKLGFSDAPPLYSLMERGRTRSG